jgi:hypothetical protein
MENAIFLPFKTQGFDDEHSLIFQKERNLKNKGNVSSLSFQKCPSARYSLFRGINLEEKPCEGLTFKFLCFAKKFSKK